MMLGNQPHIKAKLTAALKLKLYQHIITQFIKDKKLTQEECIKTLKSCCQLSSTDRTKLWGNAIHASKELSSDDFSNFKITNELSWYFNKIHNATNILQIIDLSGDINNIDFTLEISLLLS